VLNVRLYIQMNFLTSVADELIALNASPLNFYISFTEITKFWILCSFNGAWKRHNNPVKLCLLKSSHRVGNNILYNGRVYLRTIFRVQNIGQKWPVFSVEPVIILCVQIVFYLNTKNTTLNVIDSSHKDSYLVSLIWNSSTFAWQRVKSWLYLASLWVWHEETGRPSRKNNYTPPRWNHGSFEIYPRKYNIYTMLICDQQ
jgi:hypothetical protein